MNKFVTPDIMGRQRRYEQEGEALKKFIEATDHIKSMDAELYRQSNQLRDQTDQLRIHNDTFKKINEEMQQEAADRAKGDKASRRFSIIAVVVGCLLTFILDHVTDIFAFLTSPKPWRPY